MNGAEILFLVFALATCLGAIAVVVSQNVVRMAFWLMVSLGSVAGLFFLLRADFVAATQLLIYVGGTVVLLVFGVMLTASGRFMKIQTTPAEGFLGAGIGSLFLAMLFSTVAAVSWPELARKTDPKFVAGKAGSGYNRDSEGNTTRPIGMALIGPRTDKDLGREKGKGKLSTGYLLPFEIISIHLLVVLIGAAYLARAKRRVDVTNTE
jgi:NADH:ubiquinone oxidoreductase subunit 6 (subunit J)